MDPRDDDGSSSSGGGESQHDESAEEDPALRPVAPAPVACSRSAAPGNEHHATLYEIVLFFACGAGSSLCYISTFSSLVYFKAEYGEDAYVYLNIAVYLPLVPVALAQALYDQHHDRKMGSASAFLFRGLVGFVTSIVAMAAIPLGRGLFRLCALSVLLGTAGAILQGTFYQMASFVSTADDGRLKAAVSSGIQASAMMTLIVSLWLGFGGPSAARNEESFKTFFFVISSIEGIILVLFLMLMRRSRPVAASMEHRDSSIGLIVESQESQANDIAVPLLEEDEFEDVPQTSARDVELTFRQLWRHSTLFCTTLAITLVPSFLVGSWFTHVKTGRVVLPQVLFYDRIGADFLGRLFTIMVPPRSGGCLLTLSVSRLVVVVLFFINASVGQYFSLGDAVSVCLVFVIAFASGYLVTGCYQLAPLQLPLEQRGGNLAKQASLLNLVFSFAGLIGVSSSLFLLSLY